MPKNKTEDNRTSLADLSMSSTEKSIISKSKTTNERPFSVILVSAIPKTFRSADLRNFFSAFVESRAFRCFHFRHRPMPPSAENSFVQSQMCFVQVYNDRLKDFLRLYHRKHWTNRQGDYLPSFCLISEVHAENDDPTIQNTLIEFKPAEYLYPQGNVGTPTAFFFEQINACRLPSSIIKKLALVFPKSRSKRKYGSVAFDYKTIVESGREENFDELDLKTGTGHEILSEQEKIRFDRTKKLRSEADEKEKSDAEIDEDDEEDELEEWERHEAQYDDVTKQDRTSPYLFDHKIELKWEKGGSGLVFYTDDVFWKEHEGKDFDKLDAADDWDIDMRMYDKESGNADRDGNELQTLRREEELRVGRRSNVTDLENHHIGAFERHTKGIGRRLLERAGWQDGQGLGSSTIGISEPVTTDGAKTSVKDKTGLGYHGEKVDRNPKKLPSQSSSQIRITTVYDDPDETDPTEPTNRRSEPTANKNRPRTKNLFHKA